VERLEPSGDLIAGDVAPDAPNRVRCADIKQIKTGAGWLYLAAVRDLFSRRIIGWRWLAHITHSARGPAKGMIHHCDHGGQRAAYTVVSRA
jgi:putative transposase